MASALSATGRVAAIAGDFNRRSQRRSLAPKRASADHLAEAASVSSSSGALSRGGRSSVPGGFARFHGERTVHIVYLPEPLADRLPLFARLRAAVAAAVVPQQDAQDAGDLALVALAVGRVLRARRRSTALRRRAARSIPRAPSRAPAAMGARRSGGR